jgi:hypothetical protein
MVPGLQLCRGDAADEGGVGGFEKTPIPCFACKLSMGDCSGGGQHAIHVSARLERAPDSYSAGAALGSHSEGLTSCLLYLFIATGHVFWPDSCAAGPSPTFPGHACMPPAA